MPQAKAKSGHQGPFQLQSELRPGTHIERFDPPEEGDGTKLISKVTLNRPISAEEKALLPARVHVGRPHTDKHTFIYAMSIGPFILPPVAHDILTALEPAAHVFHEIEAICDNVSLGRHYLLVQAPTVDCVDIDATIFRPGRGGREYFDEVMSRRHGPGGGPPSCGISSVQHIALKASAIAGRHWWRPPPVFRVADFCSLALKQAFKEAGILGVQFTPCEAT